MFQTFTNVYPPGSTLGTRAAEHKGCNWGMQLIDGCSFELFSATVSVVSAGICHINKVNSIAWLYRKAQPKDIIYYITLHYITLHPFVIIPRFSPKFSPSSLTAYTMFIHGGISFDISYSYWLIDRTPENPGSIPRLGRYMTKLNCWAVYFFLFVVIFSAFFPGEKRRLCFRRVRLSGCPSVYPSVCLSVCLSDCLSVCLYVCMSVCLCVCLSVCPSVRPSVRPSVCLSVCLSVSLPLCLSLCLSVSLSVSQFSRELWYIKNPKFTISPLPIGQHSICGKTRGGQQCIFYFFY